VNGDPPHTGERNDELTDMRDLLRALARLTQLHNAVLQELLAELGRTHGVDAAAIVARAQATTGQTTDHAVAALQRQISDAQTLAQQLLRALPVDTPEQ
jgi:hypothetical protein